MASPDERRLWKAIQARDFEPAYYFYGDEELLKEQAARQLVAAAVEPATRDFNLDVRSGGTLTAEALGSLLATPPMMAERRVVLVRETSALGKDAKAALSSYLRAPASDVVLVLLEPGGDRGKPDKDLARLSGAVKFEPLSEDRVSKWITHHATTELGVEITEAAAALLYSAVGNDLPALAAELDKLASYTSGAAISESAVSAVVGVRRGETVGDLLERVVRRDLRGALAVLDHVLSQPKTSAVSVVMALTTHIIALSWAQDALRRRVPRAQLMGRLFDLLRGAGGVFTGMPWGDATRLWMECASKWGAEELDRALDTLLAADVALKETRVSAEEEVLRGALLALAGIRGEKPVLAGAGRR